MEVLGNAFIHYMELFIWELLGIIFMEEAYENEYYL
jgi:hypothetical protein